MAWTAPRTWVAAEVVTAALLNTHLRDNLNAVNNTLFIPASALLGVPVGTPSLSVLVTNIGPAWLLDAATDEEVAGWSIFPPGWLTADFVVWWTNTGAGSGDVRFDLTYKVAADAGAINSGSTTTSSTVTAPAQYVTKRTALASGVTVAAGSVVSLNVNRAGGNGADTLANDIGIIGVEIRRAS